MPRFIRTTVVIIIIINIIIIQESSDYWTPLASAETIIKVKSSATTGTSPCMKI